MAKWKTEHCGRKERMEGMKDVRGARAVGVQHGGGQARKGQPGSGATRLASFLIWGAASSHDRHNTWKLIKHRLAVQKDRSDPSILLAKSLDEFLERGKLLLVDEGELVHKEDKVLEGRVEVRLLAQSADFGCMSVVDVGIDAEQALEDILHYARECLGERHACDAISAG